MFFNLLVVLITIQSSLGEKCGKLVKFGDTIENKAQLSQFIIVTDDALLIGKLLVVKKAEIIKGEVKEPLKSYVIDLSKNSGPSDPCKYKKIDGKKIMFLDVISIKEDQFKLVFNSEPYSSENIKKIKSINCKGCDNKPKPEIKEVPGKSQLLCEDSKAKLPTIFKWVASSKLLSSKAILPLNSKTVYKCTAENVAGSTDVYIQYRVSEKVTRCTLEEDKSFCSNNGKCYSEKDQKFCRCNAPYMTKNCKQGNTIQNTISIAMTKISVIGALIVIGGVLIILIILVCMWRCCQRKIEDEYVEDDFEKQTKTSRNAPMEEAPLHNNSDSPVARNNRKHATNIHEL